MDISLGVALGLRRKMARALFQASILMGVVQYYLVHAL
jgi:hypothetical protein